MTRSREIGRFTRSRQGGWEGEINTLMIRRAIRFVPNDDRSSAAAPAFRVMLGRQTIGEAWEGRSSGQQSRDYWRVQIEDPHMPIDALLFPDAEQLTARLLWCRRSNGSSRDR